MQIELIKDVACTQELSKKNTVYFVAEVTYKNLQDGKVASRKVMSFDGAFKGLNKGKEGEKYNVTSEKKGDFWNWTEASIMDKNTTEERTDISTGRTTAKTAAPRSNYETPEERARRQVYIVRQSSISAALGLLLHNKPKEKVSQEEVIEVAKDFVKYVFDCKYHTGNIDGILDMEDVV